MWRMTVIDWLLDADPSIRWRVMRDIAHEPEDVVAAERAKVATEGWGARLLALQAPDGLWGGAAWSQNVHEGDFHFEMEAGEGTPSRWNTLRALRVLDWSAKRG